MRLLTLPVIVARVPLQLGFEVAKRVTGTAAGAAKLAYDLVAGEAEQQRPPEPPTRRSRPPSGNGRPRESERPVAPGETAVTEPDPVADAEAAIARAEARVVEAEAPAAEPLHVGEEPELVAEVAEQGAEDGAGAEVTLGEPWPGYDEMTAADIVDRLVAEGDAAAATVSLYEASKKGRASVLEAASRSMRG